MLRSTVRRIEGAVAVAIISVLIVSLAFTSNSENNSTCRSTCPDVSFTMQPENATVCEGVSLFCKAINNSDHETMLSYPHWFINSTLYLSLAILQGNLPGHTFRDRTGGGVYELVVSTLKHDTTYMCAQHVINEGRECYCNSSLGTLSVPTSQLQCTVPIVHTLPVLYANGTSKGILINVTHTQNGQKLGKHYGIRISDSMSGSSCGLDITASSTLCVPVATGYFCYINMTDIPQCSNSSAVTVTLEIYYYKTINYSVSIKPEPVNSLVNFSIDYNLYGNSTLVLSTLPGTIEVIFEHGPMENNCKFNYVPIRKKSFKPGSIPNPIDFNDLDLTYVANTYLICFRLNMTSNTSTTIISRSITGIVDINQAYPMMFSPFYACGLSILVIYIQSFLYSV